MFCGKIRLKNENKKYFLLKKFFNDKISSQGTGLRDIKELILKEETQIFLINKLICIPRQEIIRH